MQTPELSPFAKGIPLEHARFTINLGLLGSILGMTFYIASRISLIEYKQITATEVNLAQQTQIVAIQLEIQQVKERLIKLEASRKP
jgi:hypothetical protein